MQQYDSARKGTDSDDEHRQTTISDLRTTRAYSGAEVQRLLDVRGRVATRAALARVDVAERHLTEFAGDDGVDRGRGVATDGGEQIEACPECDSSQIYERTRKTPTWRCSKCKAEFNEPTEREEYPSGTTGDTVPDVEPASTTQLTRFQVDVLRTVGDKGPVKGVTVKSSLQARYDAEVNHGRLYPNLDALAEVGLIEKGQRDRRTNEYALTDAGWEVLRERATWIDAALDGLTAVQEDDEREGERLVTDGGDPFDDLPRGRPRDPTPVRDTQSDSTAAAVRGQTEQLERIADALEAQADHQRLQTAALTQLVATLDERGAQLAGAEESGQSRSLRSVTTSVEDAAVHLTERVDLDAVDRWADTSEQEGSDGV